MLQAVTTFALMIVCVTICFAFFLVGFYIGGRIRVYSKEKRVLATEAESKAKKKAERELENFLSYTGYENP